MIGKVVSARVPGMVIVVVTHIRRHPIYKKAIRNTRRFAVASDLPEVAVGDYVEISETRPMSKTKHFKVTKKL